MKIVVLSLLMAIASISLARTDKEIETTQLNVRANCEMCVNRIKTAVDIKGVKKFNFDLSTNTLDIQYKKAKTDLETIKKAILNAGYDVEDQLAPEAKEKALPGCCRRK